MSNQVENNSNTNSVNNNLHPNYQINPYNPNYQQNLAAFYSQPVSKQPVFVNGIDVNAARRNKIVITDKWKTREPMDGKRRASFCDCCWRGMGFLAICSYCMLTQMLTGPICNAKYYFYYNYNAFIKIF